MNPNEIKELLTQERIIRIIQREIALEVAPPEAFRSAVLGCLDKWEADRDARHVSAGLVYHYCDAHALHNILRTGKVWATSTKYLNDSTELLSMTANLRSHGDRHRGGDVSSVIADFFDFYSISADRRQTQTIGFDRYACCFSSNGDLLSQWRAYGNNGRGYAIGFDASAFGCLTAEKTTAYLRRITYGGDGETRLVDDLVSRFALIVEPYIDILDSTGWGVQSARNWLSLRFGECLFDMAEEIKHPAFAEETEWRLYPKGAPTLFRVSQDRIVPYKEISVTSSLEDDEGLLPIREIVVGPRLDFHEAEMALIHYTSELGYGTTIPVSPSRVPYR